MVRQERKSSSDVNAILQQVKKPAAPVAVQKPMITGVVLDNIQKPIIYKHSDKKPNIEGLQEALSDIQTAYGEKWSLFGEDPRSEYNTLNTFKSRELDGQHKTIRYISNMNMVRFLYEFDTIGLDEQFKIMRRLAKLNVLQRAVFSGSKSIHFIIEVKIKSQPMDKMEYRYLHRYMAEQLGLTQCDMQCIDPTRLTRAPNVRRKSNGNIQTLLYYNNTTRFPIPDGWRRSYKNSMAMTDDAFVKGLLDKLNKGRRRRLTLSQKRDFADAYISKEVVKGSFDDGYRHNNVPRIVKALKLACDLSVGEVQELLRPFLVDLPNQDLWNSIEKLYDGAD